MCRAEERRELEDGQEILVRGLRERKMPTDPLTIRGSYRMRTIPRMCCGSASSVSTLFSYLTMSNWNRAGEDFQRRRSRPQAVMP
jgi:hypothetical protein